MIQVIDNALSQEEFKSLKEKILSYNSDPSWHYGGIVYHEDKEKQLALMLYNAFQPTHELFFDLEPLFFHIQPRAFIRVKINRMFRTEEPFLPAFHTDVSDSTTAVFHLTTTNGKTVFKSGEEFDAIENRLIIFDSNLEHTGYTCTDKDERIVLNLNYVRRNPKEDLKREDVYANK